MPHSTPAGCALVFWALSISPIRSQTNLPAPDPVRSSITVMERIVAEAPASATTLGRDQIDQQPGVNLDDRLRSVPGFTLFRRASSLVANPTTQGVSLRGLGSSGASRTLILWDGVPLNDPFGGWVYWTRVAPDDVSNIEVFRGASTSVFGDRAMSGVIAIASRPSEDRTRWSLSSEGGNRDTQSLAGGFGTLWSGFGASANLRAFQTDGYFTVPGNRRGTADREAGVRFAAGNTRLDYTRGQDRLALKLDILAEERANGTALTRNSTSLGTLSANYSRQWASDTVSILGYHTREQYHSSFSSISANRNTESITFLQTVPSDAVGAAGIWKRSQGRWNLTGGADMQRVEGYSTDRLRPTGVRIGGGSQFQRGVFGQFDASAGPVKIFLGAREQATGQDSRFFSPSAGATVGKGWVRGRASVYRSFRAPTLNELFREFRVGNAITQANSQLRPETVFGAETGVDMAVGQSRASFSLYRHSLENLITNVTLSSTPALITRQRRNAASALARGVEIEWRRRWTNWMTDASYLFSNSRFGTGERIPQVPRHQGSLQITFLTESTLASVGVRSFGSQFEDDRNQFLLAGYPSVQTAVRQRITRQLSAIVSIENLLDRTYFVGFSPTPLIGAPRLWRVGLRWGNIL